jgi:hypothetical protein
MFAVWGTNHPQRINCSTEIPGRVYLEPVEPSEGYAEVPDYSEKCGEACPWILKRINDMVPGIKPTLRKDTPQLVERTEIMDLTSTTEKEARTETRNILFMDLSNWSKSPAHKVLGYLNKALPCLAEIVHINFWIKFGALCLWSNQKLVHSGAPVGIALSEESRSA